jgi:hypothetical protein
MTEDDNQFETIEAADITLTHSLEQTVPDEVTRSKPLSLYIIITLSLASLALLAILLMQSSRHSKDPTDSHQDIAPQAQPAISREPGPFQQQQTAAARRGAQNTLARIIEKKQLLETKNVTQWAEQSYLGALARAEQGDLLYRQQLFDQAQAIYLDGEAELLQIESSIEPLIESTLREGQIALDSGDQATAEASFNLVLAIEADNQAATTGMERTILLPQVLLLTTEANFAFSEGNLEGALVLINQLLKIDARYKPAIETRIKINGLLQEAKFQSAMNQGYNLLSNTDYPAAIQAFKRALAVQPTSTVAGRALAQAKNEYNESRVNSLLETAISREKSEQWQQATEAYRQILEIDSTVVAAKVGEIRSKTRAKLDSNIAVLIARPLRLSSHTVFQQAQKLLIDARKLQAGSPQLSKKIIQLESLLIYATTPRAVTLTSDSATIVTVLKIGEVGLFDSRIIELKPGNYVAEGVRSGYRDVRVDFVVGIKQAIADIHIACIETI